MNVRQCGKALGRAAYLGGSWTWCIGMFLPVMLLRDFGEASWFVFTVPNVIGAAAMGFVFSNGRASEGFVLRHKSACTAFSVVTILFQCYFLVWATAAIHLPAGFVVGLLLLLLPVYWFSRPQGSLGTILPASVFILSLIAMIVFAKELPFSRAFLCDPAFGRMAPELGLLVPVFVFGFLFSPYLDLTFHHVSQQTTSGMTKVAFVVGFGVVFLSMLVFTLLYAPSVVGVFFEGIGVPEAPYQLANRTGLRMLLFGYFVLQAGLTAMLHVQRLKRQVKRRAGGTFLFLLLVTGVSLLLWACGRNRMLFHLTGPELIYRAFLGFYGLMAPAYIWICAVPFKSLGINRKVDWIAFGGAVCLALPLFAWSFLAGEYRASLPGLCLVLTAPLARSVYVRWTQNR